MNSATALRDGVREVYSSIAQQTVRNLPFPTGRALAEDLGYPPALLDTIPATSVEGFFGISNVSLFARIPEGATVLDLGAGAGLDTLIAARRTGEQGKVIAIDFSAEMADRARLAAAEMRAANVEVYLTDAERLPIKDASIDVALVNGIFNLNPCREQIFSELSRVLKTGGSVYAAELVLTGPLPAESQQSAADWFT
jgi:arsenite methyltransferase